MDATIKANWVSALRSGDYEQGQGALNSDGKFCCLGVLCDLAVKADLPVPVEFEECCDDEFEKCCDECAGKTVYDGNGGYLPWSVMEWAGLNSSNPIVQAGPGESAPLAKLNDSGRSFDDIATLIEENL